MGIAGIVLGGGWLLWELHWLLGSPRCEKPRRLTKRRGGSGLFGGSLLALGVLHSCNPQPWLPYLMGGAALCALFEGVGRMGQD